MKIRLGLGVRTRSDAFGGICYIPSRDDFFAVDAEVFPFVEQVKPFWTEVSRDLEDTYKELAKFGICETNTPSVRQIAYSGPSFLGHFKEIPTVEEPLVLNCFCTSFCPLVCQYCHADDLMQGFRTSERATDIDNVISTARSIPSMVVVITGGDPLSRPDRAIRLIEGLAPLRALVLDTSGIGDLDSLLPVLVEHSVHVRVSLDSANPQKNDKLRPLNPKLRDLSSGTVSGLGTASKTIERCLSVGLNVSVQTVVSSVNENIDEWRQLRAYICNLGVRNWVMHIAVNGGSARRRTQLAMGKRRGGILPSSNAQRELWKLIQETRDLKLNLDIRCTDTDTTPNSVLLVGSRGDLFTEGYAHHGKVRLFNCEEARPDMLKRLWPHLDRFGHARRYLNWNKWLEGGESLEKTCHRIPLPPKEGASTSEALVETEVKYRIADPARLRKLLRKLGYIEGTLVLQRDEYFDTKSRTIADYDFVVRFRIEAGRTVFCFKTSRLWTKGGAYSRLEFEITAKDSESVRRELEARGLERTWYFEKRRTEFRRKGSSKPIVAIDEVPSLGFFLEIEGRKSHVELVASDLSSALGTQERMNYKEIFVREMRLKGKSEISGAEFTQGLK